MMRPHLRRILAVPVLVLLAVAVPWPPPTRADPVTWTLLDESEWSDPFSPLYVNSLGEEFEGDPYYAPQSAVGVFTYQWLNPDTQEVESAVALENNVLVNFQGDVTAGEIGDILEDNHLAVITAWFDPNEGDSETSISWFQLEILPESDYYDDVLGMVATLESLTDVEFAEPNDLIPSCSEFPDVPPDDTQFKAGNQPELGWLNALDAWDQVGYGEKNTIAVAVFDNGVDVAHPDLGGKIYHHPSLGDRRAIVATRKGHVTVKVDSSPNTIFTVDGKPWMAAHGTAVAGIVGAETNNDLGVASCGPEVEVLPVAIENPSYTDEFITGAVVNAVKELHKKFKANQGTGNVLVVNFSHGFHKEVKSIRKAMNKDRKSRNRLYSAAAGNERVEARTWPAADPKILGVTGAERYEDADRKHIETTFWCGPSEEDPDLDVYGISGYYEWSMTTDIHGADGASEGDYVTFAGTSAACPQIAALAALMWSEDPTREVGDIDLFIKQSTKDGYPVLSFWVDSNRKGIPGVVDFLDALERVTAE